MNPSEDRKKMVEEQLIPRGISDKRVIDAFLKVPREKFIASDLLTQSYVDFPLPIGYEQTISQPYTVAFMTELLKLKEDEKVLEIGTGSGYQAAILSMLCRQVYTIERIPELADKAKAVLEILGYKNVEVIKGDGSLGLVKYAPYDAIIVTAAAQKIPEPFIAQLSDGGRLVIPVGDSFLQQMTRVTRESGEIKKEVFGGFVFVPLIGEHGWSS